MKLTTKRNIQDALKDKIGERRLALHRALTRVSALPSSDTHFTLWRNGKLESAQTHWLKKDETEDVVEKYCEYLSRKIEEIRELVRAHREVDTILTEGVEMEVEINAES